MYIWYHCVITDIDECDASLDLNDCEVEASCTNTDGSYTCECDLGFELQPNGRQCHGQFNNICLSISNDALSSNQKVDGSRLTGITPAFHT